MPITRHDCRGGALRAVCRGAQADRRVKRTAMPCPLPCRATTNALIQPFAVAARRHYVRAALRQALRHYCYTTENIMAREGTGGEEGGA